MAIDFSITRDVKDNPWIYYVGSDISIVSSRGVVVLYDKDLWATEKGGVWKVYQWWNNYAFDPNTTPTIDTNRVDVTNYWPPSTNPHGYYSSSTWINSGSSAWFTNPADPTAHWFTLWWGGTPEPFDAISTPAQQIDRKWPCPDGYFIPSTWDFNFLMQVLADIVPNVSFVTNANGTAKISWTGLVDIANLLLLHSSPSYTYKGSAGDKVTSIAAIRRTCNEYLSQTMGASAYFNSSNGVYTTLDTDRYHAPSYWFGIRPFKSIVKR
jgi:hypothetical protein